MYSMSVKAYNEEREHGGINGHTPSEMFLMKGTRLNNFNSNNIVKQIKEVLPMLVSESVTYLCKYNN